MNFFVVFSLAFALLGLGEILLLLCLRRKASQTQQELDSSIADCMAHDRFSLLIQPVMDLNSGFMTGGEALSRLHHQEQGLVTPDDFLQSVSAARLSSEFDKYIFEKSCATFSRSREEGAALSYLSCNFSRKTLSEENIVLQLSQIADMYQIPHELLAIEVTEQEPETDMDAFARNLNALKENGFRIFLDDFGTGVTSVKDLMRYPLDIVKIDRSLLLAADTEQGQTAFRGLVSLACALGAKVVCEGIETEDQHRLAVSAGCHYGQGFLFSRPLPPESICRSHMAQTWLGRSAPSMQAS